MRPMNPERWQQIKIIVDDAMQQAPNERPAFLDQACDGDGELRREVEVVLTSLDDAKSFMEQTAAAEVASLIVGANSRLTSGQRLAHYQITRPIGAGGMGEVYLAQDTKLDRKVALKILPADLASNQDRMRRFVQEAKAASALNHPNIITIYEIDETDSNHFIATEFIEGETLREREQKPLRLSESLDIATQIASALAAAHAAGIVHRDIKPENVMLRRDGIVKVLDFGLAKLTAPPSIDSIDS